MYKIKRKIKIHPSFSALNSSHQIQAGRRIGSRPFVNFLLSPHVSQAEPEHLAVTLS